MKTADEILRQYPRRQRKENGQQKYFIPFEEAVKAMNEYALQFIHTTKCWACDGVGKIEQLGNMTCQNCKGEGKVILLPTITTTGT